MRKAITLLLFLSVSIFSFAYDFAVNNIYYKITGANTCKVTYASLSYNSYSGNVTIPSTVSYNATTYTVNEIDSAAFALSTSLTSVSLPNTIVKIDSSAFVMCTSLQSVNIPASVRYIGSAAFGMTAISTITIPDSVRFLGGGMFYGCDYLATVNYNAINATHGRYYDEDMGFSLCPNMGYCSSLTRINIGTNVVNFPRAFCVGATALTNLIIPDNVVTIGDSAFMNTGALGSVQIGSGVTSIGASAFAMSGISALTIRAVTPPTLGTYAFTGSNSSMPVYVPCQSIRTYRANASWSSAFNNISGGPSCNFTVTILSENAQYGSTTGSGQRTYGDTVQIAAIPQSGYIFREWNDGNTQNPRDIIIFSDTTFIAYFDASSGIEEATENGVIVVASNRTITAHNVQAGELAIYDLGGRCLIRETVAEGATMRFAVPAAGVYVVRNNGGSVKIIVK